MLKIGFPCHIDRHSSWCTRRLGRLGRRQLIYRRAIVDRDRNCRGDPGAVRARLLIRDCDRNLDLAISALSLAAHQSLRRSDLGVRDR